MPRGTYSEAFSFVFPLPKHSIPALTMDPTAPPPLPNPTTPERIFPRTKHAATPNKFAPTFAVSSQPVGSTQRALQESLTNNVVFANEEIVQAIFQPSKVDNETVMKILTEINNDESLKAAYGVVLRGTGKETTKYKPMVRHLMIVSERANLNPLAYAV